MPLVIVLPIERFRYTFVDEHVVLMAHGRCWRELFIAADGRGDETAIPLDLDRILVRGLLEVSLVFELHLAHDLWLANHHIVSVGGVLGHLLLDRHLSLLHNLDRLQVSRRLLGQSIGHLDL